MNIGEHKSKGECKMATYIILSRFSQEAFEESKDFFAACSGECFGICLSLIIPEIIQSKRL